MDIQDTKVNFETFVLDAQSELIQAQFAAHVRVRNPLYRKALAEPDLKIRAVKIAFANALMEE